MADYKNTWESLDGKSQAALGFFCPNITDFLQQMPYREGDPAGQKFEKALKENENNFRERFEQAIADSEVRAGIAELPPDVLAENVDAVIARPEDTAAILADAQAGLAPATAPAASEPVGASAADIPDPAGSDADQPAATDSEISAQSPAPEPVEAVASAVNMPDPRGSDPGMKESGAEAQAEKASQTAASQRWEELGVPATVAGAAGFTEFMQKVADNDDMSNAFSALIDDEGDGAKMEQFMGAIEQRVQDDPEFFVKLNEMADKQPELMSTMARKIIEDPAAAMGQLDMAMALDKFMDTPFGHALGAVGEHLMGILGPLMEVMGEFLGKLPEMMEELGQKINGFVQDFADKPRHVVTNDPDGKTPLSDDLKKIAGKEPSDPDQQTAYDHETGQEIVQTPAPGEAPAPQQAQNPDPNDPVPGRAPTIT